MDPIVLLLVIFLVLALVGALPRWPYSQSWSYGPTYVVIVVAIVLLILILVGRVPLGIR